MKTLRLAREHDKIKDSLVSQIRKEASIYGRF